MANTIDEFFTHTDPTFRDDLIALDALLTPLAPAGTRKLYNLDSITILGYGEITLSTKAKGQQVWPIISLAPQVNGISIYVNGEENGIGLATYYKPQLGKVSCGKNCVRVSKLSKLNTDALLEMANKAFQLADF